MFRLFYKKDGTKRNHTSIFDSVELVAGCGSLFNPQLVEILTLNPEPLNSEFRSRN